MWCHHQALHHSEFERVHFVLNREIGGMIRGSTDPGALAPCSKVSLCYLSLITAAVLSNCHLVVSDGGGVRVVPLRAVRVVRREAVEHAAELLAVVVRLVPLLLVGGGVRVGTPVIHECSRSPARAGMVALVGVIA
jgi:hypothetical protein